MFHFENEWFQLATLRLHFTDKHASHLPIRFRKLKSQFSVWNQNKNIGLTSEQNPQNPFTERCDFRRLFVCRHDVYCLIGEIP